MTPDPVGAGEFYRAVFGWLAEPGKDASGYLHLKNGEAYIGGIPPAEHRDAGSPPHWLLYLLAENCDAATAKAAAAGAKVYAAPMSMEGVGRWSVVPTRREPCSPCLRRPGHKAVRREVSAAEQNRRRCPGAGREVCPTRPCCLLARAPCRAVSASPREHSSMFAGIQ